MYLNFLTPKILRMCVPILVTPIKLQAHNSQSCRENATPYGVSHPLAYYQEVPPPPQPPERQVDPL